MEKKDKRRKKLDDGKPNAENVINELLEGVDLKQGPTGEADSKYLILGSKAVLSFIYFMNYVSMGLFKALK